jgi:tRNA U34 5-methylaminomethyl-2-thiouridine-forming methyltransferase MnmC
MIRQLIITDDGSHSLFVPELDEQYHSIHGAIQESEHVFIRSGLALCSAPEIVIFELGFGTGLNAFLSQLFAEQNSRKITFITSEKYQLTPTEYESLNYASLIDAELNETFLKLHRCNWNVLSPITNNFQLLKLEGDFRNLKLELLPRFDLVFFDAFAPNKLPDLWNEMVYSKIFNQCNPGAVLVTYCAKGIVRRGLQQVGFRVERIAGPPGKKEMLRAIK